MSHWRKLLIIGVVFLVALGTWWVWNQRNRHEEQSAERYYGTYYDEGEQPGGNGTRYACYISIAPFQEVKIPEIVAICYSSLMLEDPHQGKQMIPAEPQPIFLKGNQVIAIVATDTDEVQKQAIGHLDGNGVLHINYFRFHKIDSRPWTEKELQEKIREKL